MGRVLLAAKPHAALRAIFTGKSAEAEPQRPAKAMRDELLAAAPADRLPLLTAYLRQQAAMVLRPRRRDRRCPPAQRVGARLADGRGIDEPGRGGPATAGTPGQLLAGQTIAGFAHEVSELLAGRTPSASAPPPATVQQPSAADLLSQLDHMSDVQVDTLLRESLAGHRRFADVVGEAVGP